MGVSDVFIHEVRRGVKRFGIEKLEFISELTSEILLDKLKTWRLKSNGACNRNQSSVIGHWRNRFLSGSKQRNMEENGIYKNDCSS